MIEPTSQPSPNIKQRKDGDYASYKADVFKRKPTLCRSANDSTTADTDVEYGREYGNRHRSGLRGIAYDLKFHDKIEHREYQSPYHAICHKHIRVDSREPHQEQHQGNACGNDVQEQTAATVEIAREQHACTNACQSE